MASEEQNISTVELFGNATLTQYISYWTHFGGTAAMGGGEAYDIFVVFVSINNYALFKHLFSLYHLLHLTFHRTMNI
jgi:hypothetical protein